ncbi:hypothetical protein DB29_03863 [Shouchella clausii]|nr:hypothetical protein DB29_03863 [Shouchella clausii]
MRKQKKHLAVILARCSLSSIYSRAFQSFVAGNVSKMIPRTNG